MSATVGGVSTTYAYDAQGNRPSSTSASATGTQNRTWDTDVNARQPQVSLETTAHPAPSPMRGFLAAGPGGQ